MNEFTLEDLGFYDKPLIGRLDLTKRIEFANKAFVQMLGAEKRSDIQNTSFFDFLEESTPKHIINEIHFHIDKNKNWSGFARLKRLNSDGYVWVFLNIEPVLEDGIKTGYSVLVSHMGHDDISKNKPIFDNA